MIRRIGFCFFSIVAFIALANAEVIAQKGSPASPCIENPPVDYCVKINGNNYRGYLRVYDGFSPRSFLRFSDNAVVKLKPGRRHTLVVGNEGNEIVFELEGNGSIKLAKQSDLTRVTPGARQIDIKTVEIFVEPQKYEYYYYLSLFRDVQYDQGSALCPYAKKELPPLAINSEQTADLCPANRYSRYPIAVMPNAKYWIEPHIPGYGGSISFYVGANGEISGIDIPRAAKVLAENPRTLVLENKKITIETNYSGSVFFGKIPLTVTKGLPSDIIVVPFAPSFLYLTGPTGSERLFITNGSRIIPREFWLPRKDGGYAWFELK